MDAIRVEVYISSNNQEANKRHFDQLLAHKEKIEETFGKPLDWQRMETRSASRICYTIDGHGLKDREHWQEIQDKLVEEMYNLRKAFQDEIDKLK